MNKRIKKKTKHLRISNGLVTVVDPKGNLSLRKNANALIIGMPGKGKAFDIREGLNSETGNS